MRKQAEAQAFTQRRRSAIAAHLVLTLYGHWAVNDPRGSGSTEFIDRKFAPLGPIYVGRKPEEEQPTREQLRAFHEQHGEMLNFPLLWIDAAGRRESAAAVEQVIGDRGYTCYACAICRNHLHLVIRTHRDKARAMWEHFSEGIRQRLRLRFFEQISANHPVISARPYNVLLNAPDAVWRRIEYAENNPVKEGLPRQRWPFVTPYDNWPFHKRQGDDRAC